MMAAMVKPDTAPASRRKRAASLMEVLAPNVKQVLSPLGFTQISLVSRWADVVGPHWARDTMPLKLSFPPGSRRGGTLTVAIDGALATEFQHLEPVVLERIAAVFGYRAVERIRLAHHDLAALRDAKTSKRITPLPLAPDDAALTAAINRPGLRAALESLGRSLAGRDSQA